MPARAGAALQFVAAGFSADGSAAAWRQLNGTNVLRNANAATNGWTLAESFGGAVWFDGGSAVSPMEFGDGACGSAAFAMAVVECWEGADFATLIDAPTPVRFSKTPWQSPDPAAAREFEAELAGLTNSIAVNGAARGKIRIGAERQLVEARFGEAAGLDEIFIGGSPAHFAWGRGWRGGIAELILFAGIPSEREINAARRYLAAKHKIAPPTESDSEIVALLAALGIDDFGVFNTVISVR